MAEVYIKDILEAIEEHYGYDRGDYNYCDPYDYDNEDCIYQTKFMC